jgi:hypothetical protein
VTAAGCSGTAEMFDSKSDSSLFAKPFTLFSPREDGSKATAGNAVNLGPSGPVGAEELVGADGRCAPPVAGETPQAAVQQASAAPADRPVGSVAGDLAGAPMPQGATPVAAAQGPNPDPAFPPVLGGIALGMTECEAVRRAGLASNVTIGVDDKGSRKVVLTYLGGTWPGIYTFTSGRLKEISRAPEQPKSAKAPPKKKVAKKPAKKPVTPGPAPTVVR